MSHRGHHASHHGTSTDTPPDWREHAACRDTVDPEVFFPVGQIGSPRYEADAALARALCAQCQVITSCLGDAVTAGDSHGIRGGLDPDERAKQFPRARKPRPAYPCQQCGKGMGAPKRGGTPRKYCSDECRKLAHQERKAVAA